MAFQLGASSSSLSSSPSIHPRNHHVFLSFRGKDVRYKFISHLNRALRQSGIMTYMDGVDLERGEQISTELFKAIEESSISIIVLSKNYAESKWCLDEILKILDCKKKMKQIILPIFYEVKPSEVRDHEKGCFGEAFTILEKKIKLDDIKLLEYWKEALKEVAELCGFEYRASGDNELEFIQKIIRWINSKILNQTPLWIATYPIVIESRVRDIYQHLSLERNDIIQMVGIFGIGGIGKTTFSKVIYNMIFSQFDGSCFLSNIREISKREGLIKLQKILLSEILGEELDIYNADRGVNVIRERLRFRKVLLILDDVDELEQLKKLAGDRTWFGLGSRIIVTTRDQQLLKIFEVCSKYKLELWNDNNEALRLLSLHACKKDEPSYEYVDLAEQVIQYAKGLPLALAVLGSYLKGKSTHQWKSALDKYESIPHKDIQSVLQISYDDLEDNEKEMFLDIAFFFKGEPLANIKKIFDSCGFFPNDGIERLIKKCLITIEDKNVWMHDLLQDMGREIIRLESPNEPGQRSRLWSHEDIRGVLEESTGTNKVAGMIIEMPKGEDAIRLNSEAFVQMKRLRVLINRNASFSSGPNYLSNELRVLDWFEYPLQSLPPNFHGSKLIIFKMRGGFIRELSFIRELKNMTIMKFSHCNFLTKVPDLSNVPNLKELIIERCTNLVEVHNSVGSLEYLCQLSFFGCSNLRILPASLKLRSLRTLNLSGCSSLSSFPEIGCKMKSLTTLALPWSAVEELPLSIGNLTRLDESFLRGCKNLKCLPINIILRLQHLRRLGGCTNLPMEDEISSNEGQLQELALPTNSSNGSSALQVLNCHNCFQSESNFFPISSFFTMFNSSATLTNLDQSGSTFVSLPTSIKGFVALIEHYLKDCKKLEEIAELPPNIANVFAEGCQSLERFPEVSRILEFNGSHIRSLGFIGLEGCEKMHEKIWNYKVANPLLWKGHYNATVLPENEIPECLWYQKEFLENKIAQRGDDDFQLKGNEEWVINIEGPHHLEDISGIVICVVTFFKEDYSLEYFVPDAKITSISSNCVCRIDSEESLFLSNHDVMRSIVGQYEVWLWYSDLESFELKVLDNFHGKKLIIFQMHSSIIGELSCIKCFINLKNIISDCNFFTKVLDLSSVQNLKLLMIIERCTNLVVVHNSVGSLGYDGQSILATGSTTMEDEISSNEEQLQELAPPTNSSNGSSALQVLNRQNCFQLESNFVPMSSVCTMFNVSTTLTILDLWKSEFVSLPTSIKGFVALIELQLEDCEKLEEILELPPNIELVNATGCKSLERFPEVSRILEFNRSHIRSLLVISLDGCVKMHERIRNYKVPNPLLWKARHYNASILPKNQILEGESVNLWDEAVYSKDDVVDRGDKELVINIEGPRYLEDMSGIVVYAFLKIDLWQQKGFYRILRDNTELTIKSSICECLLKSSEAVYMSNCYVNNKFGGEDSVLVSYFDLDICLFELKVLNNLRVQLHHLLGNFYRSWGANIVYKHESKAHKRRKMD